MIDGISSSSGGTDKSAGKEPHLIVPLVIGQRRSMTVDVRGKDTTVIDSRHTRRGHPVFETICRSSVLTPGANHSCGDGAESG